MKNYLITFLLLNFAAVGIAFAQTDATAAVPVEQAETVTTGDLGLANPGLLPTNPFYFLKEWGRGIRSFATFNSVAKAELELRFVNEKAAEVKKVEELKPAETEAISKALDNYQGSQQRLKIRLENLKETSQNPNVDRLLEQLADRTIKHEKVFDEIANKFEDKADIQKLVRDVKNDIEETATVGASKDDPAKFASKLERALVAHKGSELKHVRSLEIIDRLEQKASGEVKQSLGRLRQDFSLRLKEDIGDLLKKKDSSDIQSIIERIPGDQARRSVILEEIQEEAERPVAEAISKVTKVLDKAAEKGKNIVDKAENQLRQAEERVQKLRNHIAEIGEKIPTAVKNLLNEAENNLKDARLAFAAGKYGEAFGKARSAEVIARNALRILEKEEQPDNGDLKADLHELEAKITGYAELLSSKGFTREKDEKIFVLLDEARKHLGFAREAISKNDIKDAKIHKKHVKEFIHDLARIIEGKVIFETKQRIIEAPLAPTDNSGVTNGEPRVFCTQEYDPVCGINNKTYSNTCMAKVAGIGVQYKGECRIKEEVKRECGPMPSLAPPREGCKYDGPVCKEGEWKYKLICLENRESGGGSSGIKPAPAVEAAPSTRTKAASSVVTVVIDQNGNFSPSAVKVSLGGKVTWINKSERSVWPASDFHPTHQLYQGFDALHGLITGESYSFVLEKGGSWKYHDHLNPSFTGVVEVIE